ncbi:MAG: hypothetical protein IPN77_08510 [Sandaracinaceae bacterium]|nr:hypothetical protein [Sandaracinaceae bacterium]MBP7682839.1 hypothetical protein [Deltaproteobacteria bacterium]
MDVDVVVLVLVDVLVLVLVLVGLDGDDPVSATQPSSLALMRWAAWIGN